MGEHTKGEWNAEPCGELAGKHERMIVADLGLHDNGMHKIRTIGRIFDHAGEAESLANARLIAAAPGLLEVVEAGIAAMDGKFDLQELENAVLRWLPTARTALSAASGRAPKGE